MVGWADKQLHLVGKQQFHILTGTQTALAAEERLQQMVPNHGASPFSRTDWAGQCLSCQGIRSYLVNAPRQNVCLRPPEEA